MSRQLLSILAFVFLAGCASLDPTADVDRVTTNIRDRSGYEAAWHTPWSEKPEAWDGRSELALKQAVLLALQNNRAIRADVEQIGVARADLVQAGLLPNPIVNIMVGSADNGVTVVGASVAQEFAALWLRSSRVKAADARLNQTVLDVSDRALRLVSDVQQNYVRIVFGESAVRLTQSHISLLEKSIDVMTRRVAAGSATSLDVNRLRLQLLDLQTTLIRQNTDLQKFRRTLLEQMGVATMSTEWQVSETGLPLASLPQDLTEQVAIDLAQSQRLDVLASRFVYESRRAALRTEELSRIQSLGLGVEFQRDTGKINSIGPTVSIPVPIFDTNQARIAGAEAQFRAAVATGSAVQQRAVAQARIAWVDFRNSESLATTYQQQILELAAKNLSLTEAALKAGQVDVTILLESQREVIKAKLELNLLQANAMTSLIELEYAVGGKLLSPTSTAGP